MGVWQLQCSRVRRSLYSYMKGDIEGLEKYMIKEHLNECPSCMEEYERIQDIQSILSNIGKRTKAPLDLSFGIMNAIDLEKYKVSGIYALNNLKNWGISFIAAGFIIAAMNINPFIDVSTNHSHNHNTTISNIGKIQDGIIAPIKLFNRSIVDVAGRISQYSRLMTMEDNSMLGDE